MNTPRSKKICPICEKEYSECDVNKTVFFHDERLRVCSRLSSVMPGMIRGEDGTVFDFSKFYRMDKDRIWRPFEEVDDEGDPYDDYNLDQLEQVGAGEEKP